MDNDTNAAKRRKENRMAPKSKERAVVVTTDKRGVFFGYVTGKTDGETIELSRARMCVYWSAGVRGVVGLAATGPTSGCRVTRSAPSIELRGVTAVMDVTPDAVAAWEREIWS